MRVEVKGGLMELSSRDTARIFGALSDVTRVEIVRLIAEAPRNVSQLTSLVGVSQPKVSRHLRILRDAGLVTDVRRGKWVWYELAAPSEARPGSTAVTAVSGLFEAAVSRREDVHFAPREMTSTHQPSAATGLRIAGDMTGVRSPARRAGTRGGPAGGGRGVTAGRGESRKRISRARKITPTKPHKRAPSRKKKEPPRKELEDFLL
jgi:DNA-binding transcriptional ArsR family regulator